MSKGTIVWLSDSPLSNTGYATASRTVCNGLVALGWKIVYMGHNYLGQTLPAGGVKFKDGTVLNFELQGAGLQQYCQDLIEPTIKREQADIFLILLDTFMTYPWLLNLDLSPARSIFYFPTDGGGGLPLGCENILRKMTLPVAMATFGQRQAKEQYGIESAYIPLVIDPRVYYPLPPTEKDRLKAKYGLTGKFVVGLVARNQGRKMLDRTFKTFKLICAKYPDMVLFMHTDPLDAAQVFPMYEMTKRMGLENRVIFSGMRYYNNHEYREMNEIYNVMDIFFLSTSGEGFGIPIIEAMSCEIPCVVTDYTTTQELLIDNGVCGEAVPLSAELTGSWMVERAIMDDQEAANRIEKLYKDPELRKQYGKVGRQKVLDHYDCEKAIITWDKLFTDLVNK